MVYKQVSVPVRQVLQAVVPVLAVALVVPAFVQVFESVFVRVFAAVLAVPGQVFLAEAVLVQVPVRGLGFVPEKVQEKARIHALSGRAFRLPLNFCPICILYFYQSDQPRL